MKYENTDKIIADKYLSVEHDFDVENAWEEFQPKLKRKKKRGFWLFFMAGILLFVLLGIYQFSQGNVGSSKSEFAPLTKNQEPNHLTQEVAQSSQNEVETNTLLLTQQSNKPRFSANINSSTENNEIRKNIAGVKKTQVETRTLEEHNERNKTEKEIWLIDDFTSTNELSALKVKNQFYENVRKIKSFDLLKKSLFPLKYNRQKVSFSSNDHVFIPPIEPQNNKNRMRFGINGGYFIHSRSIQYSGVGSIENYNSRINEEKAIDAFDLGLTLDYFITNKLVAFGGIRLDHSFVERNADYVYLESITIPDYNTVVIATENGTIEETSSLTYDGYYHHKSNNFLSSKRLGVLAGLQYRIGSGKWSSHINLGVEFPIWTDLSGIITNDGKPYNLSSGELDISTKAPLIFGGVGADYSIMDGIGLQIMVVGYLPTGNEYKGSYDIIKKSTQLGLSLGVHFQL